jgi:hypothetical protein
MMRRLQTAGGAAAILFAVAVAAEMALFLIAIPALGGSLNDLNDPAKYAKLLARGQALFVAEGILFALACASCFALVRALRERVGETGTSLGYAGYTLLLVTFSVRVFLALDTQNAAQAIPGLTILGAALGAAGGLLLGIWIGLTAWSALSSSSLPRPLAYYSFLVGLALVVSGVLPVPVFIPLLLIWSLWIGVAILMQPEFAPGGARAFRAETTT